MLEQSCLVLRELALDNDSKKLIVSNDGIQAISKVMTMNPDAEALQLQGCGALGNLICGNPSSSCSLIAAGGVGNVVQALAKYPTSAALQREGCYAIRCLSDGNAQG